jgi:hypothetical protein
LKEFSLTLSFSIQYSHMHTLEYVSKEIDLHIYIGLGLGLPPTQGPTSLHTQPIGPNTQMTLTFLN